MIELKKHKFIVYVILIIFILAASIQAIIASKGYTSGLVERIKDILVIVIALDLCYLNLKIYIASKDDIPHLVLAAIFLLISAVHVLRFVFGGLLC